MADHSVKFSVPYRNLGRADIKFKIYAEEGPRRKKDRHIVGTLLVSHGAIEWRSRRKRKTSSIKLDWDDFDRYMLSKRNGR